MDCQLYRQQTGKRTGSMLPCKLSSICPLKEHEPWDLTVVLGRRMNVMQGAGRHTVECVPCCISLQLIVMLAMAVTVE
jgi:hypothetical protein